MQIVLLTDKFVVFIWNVNPVTVSVSEEVWYISAESAVLHLTQPVCARS